MNQFVRWGFSSFKFIKQDREPLIQVSRLSNGIHFLSEQSQFPSQSDIGIAFKTGIGSERPTERGSIHNLKKRLYHTNEHDFLQNFESITRTGAMLDIHQQSEVMYYKCQFVPEDFHNVVDTLFKLALTPKQIFSSEMEEISPQPMPFKDLVMRSAFQDQPMGNSAVEGEAYPLKNDDFLRFQLENLTPQNMAIGYSGIIPHEIIRDTIEQKLSKYTECNNYSIKQVLKRQVRQIPTYKFTRGTVYDKTEDQMINIAIIYEGLKWSDPRVGILQIAQRILGSSASWSSGGPGKGMRSRTTINLMNKIYSVESAEGYYQPLIHTGLFGMIVSGSAEDALNLVKHSAQELRGMKLRMSDEEFTRGQLCLLSNIHLQLERQSDRLEENIINFFTVGKTTDEYDPLITTVTKQEMQDYLTNMFETQIPLVVYSGKNSEILPDCQALHNRLKS